MKMEQQSLNGMTVNERLFHLGLFETFDSAARARDVRAMGEMLLRAQFSEEQALQTATAVMANPKPYGY